MKLHCRWMTTHFYFKERSKQSTARMWRCHNSVCIALAPNEWPMNISQDRPNSQSLSDSREAVANPSDSDLKGGWHAVEWFIGKRCESGVVQVHNRVLIGWYRVGRLLDKIAGIGWPARKHRAGLPFQAANTLTHWHSRRTLLSPSFLAAISLGVLSSNHSLF